MRGNPGRATTRSVTGARTIGEAEKAWQAVRADDSIQFAPLPPVEPPKREPGWLDAFFEWLGEALAPVGEALGVGWPVLRWVLLALLIAAVTLLVWRMLGPALGWRPQAGAPETEGDWAPTTGDALALLEEADRLAAEGRFGEATHLLLQRSVGQIAAVRPDLVEPSTTARELAAIGALPEAARAAFATIAARVERSLFALRALSADDWQAARAAYSDFALARLAARA